METAVAEKPVSFGIKEIKKILPHRYPFLLVDKVLELDVDKNLIIAQKNVTANEEFFQGHFPHAPIMPGVLILEALAQAGGILLHYKDHAEKLSVLLNIKEAKFRRAVHPGDVLILRVDGIHLGTKGGRIKATATVDDKVAVEAEIAFAVVDRDAV